MAEILIESIPWKGNPNNGGDINKKSYKWANDDESQIKVNKLADWSGESGRG